MEAEQLPQGWRWVRLGEVTEIVGGGTPSREHPEYFAGDILWLTPTEIPKTKVTVISTSKERITQEALKKSSARILPQGAVLMTSRASIGYVAIAGAELATNQGFASFICKDGIYNYYLAYWLFGNTDYFVQHATGTTFKEIIKSKLRNFYIPLPPLAEQERIVAKIEALFSQLEAGVAALRRAQAGLKRYKASLLKAAYEGRLVPQDPSDEPAEVVLRRLGKSPLQDASLPSLPQGWCWVTMSEVVDINLREPSIRNLPDDLLVTFVPMAAVNAEMGIIVKPEQRPLKEVRKGFTSFLEDDVIFAKITPCMENGKAAIVPKLHNGVGFGSTEFHVLRPRENVISQWLFYFVRRESFRIDAKASFTGTAGQLRVPAKFLASYPLPLPPLAEQKRIVAELEQRLTVVAQVEAAIQAALTRSARLRQAILKRAFRGEL